jgi:hypothetical protein
MALPLRFFEGKRHGRVTAVDTDLRLWKSLDISDSMTGKSRVVLK